MTAPVTAEPAEHFADLKSFRVHYWEAGAGHPVLLLHGGGPGATGMTNRVSRLITMGAPAPFPL